ncbi:MAG: dihydropteroate synthase [Defluviicoccus sp.]|nr:dihydropteroate synthase [Defluviicoccus sp.]MDE0384761.1 dihydropteroate synthase [Defluviicoccus sp.]
MTAAAPQPRPFTVEWSPGLPRGSSPSPDAAAGLALQPIGLLTGDVAARAVADGTAMKLAGGPLAFSACVVTLAGARGLLRTTAELAELSDWALGENAVLGRAVIRRLELLSRQRPPFAGLSLDRARLIGVVNVTPDSFSDGGARFATDDAIAAGRALAAAGADLIDVGGESTRPGAAPVAAAVERERVLPVIRALAADGIAVSVDSRRAGVMEAAIEAGAVVVNDVSALSFDRASAAIVAAGRAGAILMHMQGRPATMQDAPRYTDAPYEVFRYLDARAAVAEEAGIPAGSIAVDPGIGFGKNDDHNTAILAAIGLFHATGRPVVLGASRKSFIGRISRGEAPGARLPGSLAAAAAAALQGVQLFRVHDVAETRQALAVLARIGGLGVT